MNDTFVRDLNSEELVIYNLFRRIQDAMIEADMETLESLISDDAQFIHMSGAVQSKAQYLKDIEMGRLDYKHTELKDVEVTIEGEYSYVKCRAYLTATAYGATGTFPMNVKSWFQKVDGEWKYISKK